METTRTQKKGDGVVRHCAYCLQLCGSPTKLCGGCKKRAYCSKECQRADWSVKGNGQRHVNWCRRHECGEEDVDWEVVPIPNKGLGIRAKKLIPAGMRIIVEPTFFSPYDHPGIKDLGPQDATLENKFIKNNMSFARQPMVALRMARVNHSCQPNAGTSYDEIALVGILFAQKDIQPGEEISFCYYSFHYELAAFGTSLRVSGMDPKLKFEESASTFDKYREKLVSIYGITCPADCRCYDPAIPALVKEGRQIHQTVEALARQHRTEEALAAGEKLLDIHRRLETTWVYRGLTYFLLFQVVVRKSETLPRAMEYIRSAADIFRKMCPYSERHTKRYERLLEHPEKHPDYLAIDKIGSYLNGR